MYKQIYIHANTIQNSIHDTHQCDTSLHKLHFKDKLLHDEYTCKEVKVADACGILNLSTDETMLRMEYHVVCMCRALCSIKVVSACLCVNVHVCAHACACACVQ